MKWANTILQDGSVFRREDNVPVYHLIVMLSGHTPQLRVSQSSLSSRPVAVRKSPLVHFGYFLVWSCYYRPQRSWGKVIFSQASVILLTGGRSGPAGGSALGSVCSRGGGAWWRPPGTATPAGGTHPTGMHSCLIVYLFIFCYLFLIICYLIIQISGLVAIRKSPPVFFLQSLVSELKLISQSRNKDDFYLSK